MATPGVNLSESEIAISIDKQSYDFPDGSKGSLFVKDGEMIKCLYEDTTTIYEAFLRGKRVSGDGNCLGTREPHDGPYQWLKYSQVEERFINFGAGLSVLGVLPGQSTLVGLYGPNCTEWVVADYGNLIHSRVVVPLYDTLGSQAISFILNQADIYCVICASGNVGKILEAKKSLSSPQINLIVAFHEVKEEDKMAASEAKVQLYTMREVEEKGMSSGPQSLLPPKPEDLATICYTSGTTGNPKGVMLTHGNIISNISAVNLQTSYKGGFNIGCNDAHLSYLPLAHMYEREVQVNMIMQGAQIGFFRGDIKKLVEDIQELRPTIFITVPRLLNRMYDKVMATVSTSWIKYALFQKAYQSKLAETKRGIVRTNSIWDIIVFRKVQRFLGGQVRVILCGSAPVSGRVKEFVRVVFGCNMYEGYGQTESTAGLTFTFPFDVEPGHVGAVMPSARIKLRDVPEMNYLAANGQGEVCFKGPCMTQGYYKNPEKTAELFDEDGWARTGDVGEWLPNGTLKIIDRVKHIFKLSQGEYIAPEKIENVCVRSPHIAQMFVYGNSLKDCCVAIVVPDEEDLMAIVRQRVDGDTITLAEYCAFESTNEMIIFNMKQIASADGLNSLEIPKAIHLCLDPFSVDNGLLTPTFKLKRHYAKEHFAAEIESMYRKLEAAATTGAENKPQ